jgi:aminoglycoside phosphotransferase (APT) family kinase protein
MLDRYEQQLIRAALAELGGEVQSSLASPGAQAKLQMATLLLAHLLGRPQPDAADADPDAEVRRLERTQAAEQSALQASRISAPGQAELTPDLLMPYLRAALNRPALEVRDVQASLGGFSKQTYILQLENADDLGNRVVIRRDQVGGPVEAAAADEFAVVQLMHERGVAVAEPLWSDRDPPFGGSILITRMATGASAFDVSGQHLGPQGPQAARALARVLGQIHRTPLDRADLPGGSDHLPLQEHVRRMVGVYERQWQRRRVETSPTLEASFRWLYQHLPVSERSPGLVHGDASLRNLLIHEGRESAMLDWELWHIGDPNEDLAYCKPEIETVLPWQAFLDEYRAQGGQGYDEQAGAFFSVFAAVRNAVFAASCLHGVVEAENPEAKYAFGALVLGRKLIPMLAAQTR